MSAFGKTGVHRIQKDIIQGHIECNQISYRTRLNLGVLSYLTPILDLRFVRFDLNIGLTAILEY